MEQRRLRSELFRDVRGPDVPLQFDFITLGGLDRPATTTSTDISRRTPQQPTPPRCVYVFILPATMTPMNQHTSVFPTRQKCLVSPPIPPQTPPASSQLKICARAGRRENATEMCAEKDMCISFPPGENEKTCHLTQDTRVPSSCERILSLVRQNLTLSATMLPFRAIHVNVSYRGPRSGLDGRRNLPSLPPRCHVFCEKLLLPTQQAVLRSPNGAQENQ